MGAFGPNNAATFASDNILGVVAMANPANAAVSDDAYATAVLLLGQASEYLKASNFGFAIPLDATINGIEVKVERSSTAISAISDNSIRLVKSGTITGDNKAAGGTWGTSDAQVTYGSSSDLWGLVLTPADVNSASFGVAISGIASLAGTAQIDHVSITIHCTGSNRVAGYSSRLAVGGGMGRSDVR